MGKYDKYTDEQLEQTRSTWINNYKQRAEFEWSQITHTEWNENYAKRGGVRPEQYDSVRPLWGGRYGGGVEIDADGDGRIGDADAGPETTSGHRGAQGGKIMTDGINMIEQMPIDELRAWVDAGNTGTELAISQIDKLKTYLASTAGSEEGEVLGNQSADRNSITGQLMDRSGEEKNKAGAAQRPEEVPPVRLSKAGIAYDTVEYREQCFLLTMLPYMISYRHERIEAPEGMYQTAEGNWNEAGEMKRLPYVDEGITYSDSKKGKGKTMGPYNACVMVDNNTPYAFLNHLTQYGTQQHLLDMKTQDISNLQPVMRFFRVNDVQFPDGSVGESAQEIYFNTSTTATEVGSMLHGSKKRGFGVGIQSFDMTYEASNPFGIKKSITATLTIFANTFDELLQPRPGGYSYIDLCLKTGGINSRNELMSEHVERLNPKETSRKYNMSKLNFRLKAVCGWQVPPGKKLASGFSSTEIIDTIRDSFITVNLTPVTHTFDFDDTGRVVFKIEYLAYVEDFFDEKAYSIFSDIGVIERQLQREKNYATLQAMCDGESLKKYKTEMKTAVAEDMALQRRAMYSLLQNSGKLRYINLRYEDLKKFQAKGADFELEKAVRETEMAMGNLSQSERNALAEAILEYSADKEKAIGTKQRAADNQKVSLVYFYVSDLMDIILESIDKQLDTALKFYEQAAVENAPDKTAYAAYNAARDQFWDAAMEGTLDSAAMKEIQTSLAQMEAEQESEAMAQAALDLMRARKLKENFERYRLVLGPLEVLDPANPSASATVNLGDLPISFQYFMEWMTSRTLKKNEPFYPLGRFLNEFFNGLINGFLNDANCFPRGEADSKQKTHLNQSAITAYRSHPEDPDNLTQYLYNYRQAFGAYVGTDCSRLHLHYHDIPEVGMSKPVLNISGDRDSPIVERDIPSEINYAIYFAGRTQPNERMNGDIDEDAERGVMHYVAGKDRGIIKNIEFTKTETPGLKEVRLEQSGFDGLNQLRETYSVAIDTYANVGAFPGTYIFVDPRGLVPNMAWSGNTCDQDFDPADLSSYGLGGYYMIVRSSHSFGPGKADTKIDAVWVSEIASDPGGCNEAPVNVELPSETRLTKCEIGKTGNFTGEFPPVERDTEDSVSQSGAT